MNVSDYFSLKGSPSPRPSPPGRGRNAPSALANSWLTSARLRSSFKKLSNGCSLSQRERVRVRENAAAFYWSADLRSGALVCGHGTRRVRRPALRPRHSVLECGGKRSATPLSSERWAINISDGVIRAKAVSPLSTLRSAATEDGRSATALQDIADVRFTHPPSLRFGATSHFSLVTL